MFDIYGGQTYQPVGSQKGNYVGSDMSQVGPIGFPGMSSSPSRSGWDFPLGGAPTAQNLSPQLNGQMSSFNPMGDFSQIMSMFQPGHYQMNNWTSLANQFQGIMNGFGGESTLGGSNGLGFNGNALNSAYQDAYSRYASTGAFGIGPSNASIPGRG